MAGTAQTQVAGGVLPISGAKPGGKKVPECRIGVAILASVKALRVSRHINHRRGLNEEGNGTSNVV